MGALKIKPEAQSRAYAAWQNKIGENPNFLKNKTHISKIIDLTKNPSEKNTKIWGWAYEPWRLWLTEAEHR